MKHHNTHTFHWSKALRQSKVFVFFIVAGLMVEVLFMVFPFKKKGLKIGECEGYWLKTLA